MNTETNLVVDGAIIFNYVAAVALIVAAIVLSVRQRRLHPLLLTCIGAFAICWIEAPYDWSMYVQFDPGLARMPSWWPLNWTWGGGLPVMAPFGYVTYFNVPALLALPVATWLVKSRNWRRPLALLTAGLVVGFVWAFVNNALIGGQLGFYRYGRVIEGLALWPGTIHQYPLYDSLAMGVQVMLIAYLLGRTDSLGRIIPQAWADRRTDSSVKSGLLSIGAVIVIVHVVYLLVFAPHLITKLTHLQTVAPEESLYPGISNQPL